MFIEEGKETMNQEDADLDNSEKLCNLSQNKEHQPTELNSNDKFTESINNVSTEKTKKTYNTYSVEQKKLFLYYIKFKFFKAAKAAKLSGINERTAQNWAKRLREDPEWDIYEKNTNKVNRKTSSTQEEHKAHAKDAVDNLTENLESFNLKETGAKDFISEECDLSTRP